MTENKDLKRLVRARMKKTGESYTSARAQLTRKKIEPPDYAKLAGMSSAVIKEKTGCTWEKWVKSLDYHGAEKMTHTEIARLVREKYKVPAWWTQTVAVGYERIKGLRARGQARDGSYEATKSKTFNASIDTLFDAWANDRKRKQWLSDAKVRIRTATKPKSMRIDWNDAIVAVGFYAKGKDKSSVAVQHAKLPDRPAATAIKEYWSEKLAALSDVLTE
jgi:hypothetical protein